VTPSGTSFSDLHAVVQAWQPMQRVWSMTFAQRVGSGSICVRARVLNSSSVNSFSVRGVGIKTAAVRLSA
jgi:hypothetical protein